MFIIFWIKYPLKASVSALCTNYVIRCITICSVKTRPASRMPHKQCLEPWFIIRVCVASYMPNTFYERLPVSVCACVCVKQRWDAERDRGQRENFSGLMFHDNGPRFRQGESQPPLPNAWNAHKSSPPLFLCLLLFSTPPISPNKLGFLPSYSIFQSYLLFTSSYFLLSCSLSSCLLTWSLIM